MEETLQNQYTTPAFKRSRIAYSMNAALEYLISLLVTDAFLSKLLTYIGMADSTVGIVASLISFCFLFQFPTVFITPRIKNVKAFATTFNTLSSILFTLVCATPLFLEGRIASVTATVCLILGYIFNYLESTVLYHWGNSFVHPSKRGSFSAGREMLSLGCGIVFILVVGQISDRFTEIGNMTGNFTFLALVGLALTVINLICLLLIDKVPPLHGSERIPKFRDIIDHTLKNRNFVNMVILACLYQSALFITLGFLGTFKTEDLLLTVGTVQIINTFGFLARIIISKPFGKYSDKTSFAKGLELALYMMAAAFFINMFSSKSSVWCIIVFTIIYDAAQAGTVQNFNNIVYSYVDLEYFAEASALKNSIVGLTGFIVSLGGGWILSKVQENGNTVFGIEMYGQQLLSAISFVLLIISIVFLRKVVLRQSVMKQ